MRSVIAFLKLLFFAVASLLVIPPQLLMLAISRGPAAYILPHLWHKMMCSVFGIRYTVQGQFFKDGQTLYMSNHVSYLDISLLGSIIKSSFLAKSEVSGWPVFGFLSKLQMTQFIERKRTAIKDAKDNLAALMDEGKSFIIFPEGTSTDGREVVPFKSSLFTLALGHEDKEIFIQPITIKLEHVDGHGVETQEDRDLYCWHRDMDTDLHIHLWAFAKSKGADLSVTFHPVIATKDFENRKTLAKACHEQVSKGLEIEKAA